MQRSIRIEGFSDFDLGIAYSVLDRKTHHHQIEAHVHNECEIYINLTGDIAFMVGDDIYDVKRGNAIIVKPHEYHHCIYKSDELHEHFWILISVNGNENILDIFFDNSNENALVVTDGEAKERLIELCFKLFREEYEKYEKYILFFEFLKILSEGRQNKASETKNHLPEDIIFAIEYINNNLHEKIEIKDIARFAYVSVNTLERHFKEHLNMSPTEYIKDKRLIFAASLLREDKNVMEAAMGSGFCDSSYFIACFKEKFGITPFHYRKVQKTK